MITHLKFNKIKECYMQHSSLFCYAMQKYFFGNFFNPLNNSMTTKHFYELLDVSPNLLIKIY